MRIGLLLLFWIAACGHGFTSVPAPLDCAVDSLLGHQDAVHGLTGSFSLLVVPTDAPKEFKAFTTDLHLAPGRRWTLQGTAGIGRHPFPGVTLTSAPDSVDGVEVWDFGQGPGVMEVGTHGEVPGFSFHPHKIGQGGFAGSWLLIWLDERTGKERRAQGSFCALRTT